MGWGGNGTRNGVWLQTETSCGQHFIEAQPMARCEDSIHFLPGAIGRRTDDPQHGMCLNGMALKVELGRVG